MEVVKAGISDTFQDLGRQGYAHLGVASGGCMDKFASCLANALVGNDENEAVLEMHFPAPVLSFKHAITIALTGADFGAISGDTDLPVNRRIHLPAGSTIRFGKKVAGQRCYLAVLGGWQLTPVMGSNSTHLKAGFGGWKGRALGTGDEVEVKVQDKVKVEDERYSARHEAKRNFGRNKQESEAKVEHNSARHEAKRNFGRNKQESEVEVKAKAKAKVKDEVKIEKWYYNNADCYTNSRLRVMPGPEWDWLTETSKQRLMHETYTIARQSDRMGYHLDGHTLERQVQTEMLSSGVLPGTIQLLPNGRPLLLMADCQTTGGYPRILQVAMVDLPRLAQMGAGEVLQFALINIHEAIELQRESERKIAALKNAILLR